MSSSFTLSLLSALSVIVYSRSSSSSSILSLIGDFNLNSFICFHARHAHEFIIIITIDSRVRIAYDSPYIDTSTRTATTTTKLYNGPRRLYYTTPDDSISQSNVELLGGQLDRCRLNEVAAVVIVACVVSWVDWIQFKLNSIQFLAKLLIQILLLDIRWEKSPPNCLFSQSMRVCLV